MAVKDYIFYIRDLRDQGIDGWNRSAEITPELRAWLVGNLGYMNRMAFIRGTMEKGWTLVDGNYERPAHILFRAEENMTMLFKLEWT